MEESAKKAAELYKDQVRLQLAKGNEKIVEYGIDINVTSDEIILTKLTHEEHYRKNGWDKVRITYADPGRKKRKEGKAESSAYVRLVPDCSEIDGAMEKAERLKDMLNEAMELMDSIASADLSVGISAVFDDETAELARITIES